MHQSYALDWECLACPAKALPSTHARRPAPALQFALRFAAGAHRSGEVYSIKVFAYNQLGLKSLGSPSVTFLEK